MSHTQESGFGPGEARTTQTATPNLSLEPTRVGKPPLAAQLQR